MDERQTCAREESCQSDSPDKIFNVSLELSSASDTVFGRTSNEAGVKDHACSIECLELFCATDKLRELQNVKGWLVEKRYPEDVK